MWGLGEEGKGEEGEVAARKGVVAWQRHLAAKLGSPSSYQGSKTAFAGWGSRRGRDLTGRWQWTCPLSDCAV